MIEEHATETPVNYVNPESKLVNFIKSIGTGDGGGVWELQAPPPLIFGQIDNFWARQIIFGHSENAKIW